MRDSLLILACFVLGIILARLDFLPEILLEHDPTVPALWLLMALVGISIGSGKTLEEITRTLHPAVPLLPLATTLGTFAGCLALSLFISLNAWDCLAVGAGFGYYSLSSIFITQYRGPDLGTIALICNILRELFTLLFVPLVVPLFGAPAAISCGGATSMDTTLPVIARYAGQNWIMPSIAHAMVLDFSVPFWVTLFCSFS